MNDNNETINVLGHDIQKLNIHTVKSDEITSIEVPKFTNRDFINWQLEIIKRSNSMNYIITPCGEKVNILNMEESNG